MVTFTGGSNAPTRYAYDSRPQTKKERSVKQMGTLTAKLDVGDDGSAYALRDLGAQLSKIDDGSENTSQPHGHMDRRDSNNKLMPLFIQETDNNQLLALLELATDETFQKNLDPSLVTKNKHLANIAKEILAQFQVNNEAEFGKLSLVENRYDVIEKACSKSNSVTIIKTAIQEQKNSRFKFNEGQLGKYLRTVYEKFAENIKNESYKSKEDKAIPNSVKKLFEAMNNGGVINARDFDIVREAHARVYPDPKVPLPRSPSTNFARGNTPKGGPKSGGGGSTNKASSPAFSGTPSRTPSPTSSTVFSRSTASSPASSGTPSPSTSPRIRGGVGGDVNGDGPTGVSGGGGGGAIGGVDGGDGSTTVIKIFLKSEQNKNKGDATVNNKPQTNDASTNASPNVFSDAVTQTEDSPTGGDDGRTSSGTRGGDGVNDESKVNESSELDPSLPSLNIVKDHGAEDLGEISKNVALNALALVGAVAAWGAVTSAGVSVLPFACLGVAGTMLAGFVLGKEESKGEQSVLYDFMNRNPITTTFGKQGHSIESGMDLQAEQKSIALKDYSWAAQSQLKMIKYISTKMKSDDVKINEKSIGEEPGTHVIGRETVESLIHDIFEYEVLKSEEEFNFLKSKKTNDLLEKKSLLERDKSIKERMKSLGVTDEETQSELYTNIKERIEKERAQVRADARNLWARNTLAAGGAVAIGSVGLVGSFFGIKASALATLGGKPALVQAAGSITLNAGTRIVTPYLSNSPTRGEFHFLDFVR